ncbi:C6 zinc finger domain protein [Penicillium macrosclerotiorum]|uniref:C6 zinc finger domain protein n=1 Tax=Penicillium macrosclerotiorum TaxID=303699 RepID=UPI00254856FD|nr:C6 zinc finger domain protein [Penicillium macrosclerotiorum]KAJ5691761.1 C6 zinc finger domain protein [Penicillium macrosclerotiorum]
MPGEYCTQVVEVPIRPLKSRSGCKTCKIRRVKCGEEKPSCVRCTSTGRNCKYESTASGTFSSTSLPVSVHSSGPEFSSTTVWRERRAFAYYFEHTASLIGGELDIDFWRTIVPQVCQAEPAVWDAINSISALFESSDPCPELIPLRNGPFLGLNQNHRDALTWYSRSVSAVRQRIERGNVDIFVGLVTCILFICIEALQGCFEEAVQLYCQGVQLILVFRAQVATGSISGDRAPLLENTIVPLFIRLGSLAITSPSPPVAPLLQSNGPTVTKAFGSIKAARESLLLLAAEAQLFENTCNAEHPINSRLADIPEELIKQHAVLLSRLGDWHTNFTNLMVSVRMKSVLSSQQLGTTAMLLAYYETTFIILSVCLSPLQISTDAYLPNFQRILEQCSITLQTLVRSDGSQIPFTFEASIGFPLWFTGLRCREPRIRRTALALLRRSPHVQGFHRTLPGIVFCERIMILEETSALAKNDTKRTLDSNSSITFRPAIASESHMRNDLSIQSETMIAIPEPESYVNNNTGPVGTQLKTSLAALIPEEARLGPVNVFRPRDGFPQGAMGKDIVKWNGNRDQTFLQFWRHELDPLTGTWQPVHEYIPIDFF